MRNGHRPQEEVGIIATFSAMARAQVQAERHAQRLRLGPEWIKSAVSVALPFRRGTHNESTAQAQLGAAPQFLDSCLDVQQRNQSQTQETFRAIATQFRQPVVIDTEEFPLQWLVKQAK